MPQPWCSRLAVAKPMRPMPTMPSVRPARSWPSQPIGSHVSQRPALASAALSPSRRAAASSERHRDVGGGVGEHAGRVADAHAPGGARGHVHVVEADREVAHHLQPRGGVQERGVHAVGEQRHEAVAVADASRAARPAAAAAGPATRPRRRPAAMASSPASGMRRATKTRDEPSGIPGVSGFGRCRANPRRRNAEPARASSRRVVPAAGQRGELAQTGGRRGDTFRGA